MKKKYKLTAFARLLIFMIFFAPAAYIGVSYYNGENGIEKIKTIFTKYTQQDSSASSSVSSVIDSKKEEIKKLEQKIETLKEEIKVLERSNSEK